VDACLTLLTDFGWRDPYLAELKAACWHQYARYARFAARPVLIDLGHDIAPGDIAAAAWFLERTAPRFSPAAIHLVVVDPGVGTPRPLLAVQARHGTFVGPGNGVLAFLNTPGWRRTDRELTIVRLDNELYHGPERSRTFHGRDILAPVATHLAMGVPIAQVGSPATVADLGAHRGASAPPADDIIGRIVWIDRFGNALTDIDATGALGRELAHGVALQVGETCVRGPVTTYGDVSDDEPFWYRGSGDCLELALNSADAARRFGWTPGLAIRRALP